MKPDIPPIAGLPKCWLWGKCKRTRHEKMKKESVFGEYFDAQRKRQIEAMQNKNTLLHKEWREDFDKRQKPDYIDEYTQLFWWESLGT